MNINANLAREIEEAEAALKQAEVESGMDDVKVSYRLDALVRLFRDNGVRALDATNMEARARAIRVKANSADMAKVTPKMQQVSEAVKYASVRQRKEKSSRALVVACTAVVLGLVAAKFAFMPTPAERKGTAEILKKVQAVLPTTMVQGMIDKGQQAVKDVEVANKKHNDEIDQVMQGNLAAGAEK